jgi:hypothetical protein
MLSKVAIAQKSIFDDLPYEKYIYFYFFMPRVGLHKFRRSRFIAKRTEQKIKVTILLDADVLDFYKEQAAKAGNLPYQTQINRQLRKAMENARQPQSEVVTLGMLENPAFLSKLANKLKEVA